MRPSFRHGAIALALLICVGFAVASELAGLFARTGSDGDETTGSIGPNGARRTAAALPLTLEEKSRIFAHVMRDVHAPVADLEPPGPHETLPRSVPLQDLPANAAKDVPQASGYKFVKLEDRILLVDPASRVVVADMPRYKLLP